MYYWIKRRDNPQTGTYYVPYGAMSAKEARSRESSLYGYNYMQKYKTRAEYEAALAKLREDGERILDVALPPMKGGAE